MLAQPAARLLLLLLAASACAALLHLAHCHTPCCELAHQGKLAPEKRALLKLTTKSAPAPPRWCPLGAGWAQADEWPKAASLSPQAPCCMPCQQREQPLWGCQHLPSEGGGTQEGLLGLAQLACAKEQGGLSSQGPSLPPNNAACIGNTSDHSACLCPSACPLSGTCAAPGPAALLRSAKGALLQAGSHEGPAD